jgi:hypothetical protein
VPLNPGNNNVNAVVGDGASGIYVCDCQLETDSASAYYENIAAININLPSIANLLIGNALPTPDYMQQGFDPVGLTLKGSLSVSRKGIPLSKKIEFQQWSETLKFQDIQESWLRANWLPNWAKMRAQPMLWAWDATGHPDDVYWVTMGDQFSAPHKSGGRCDLQFTLDGVIPL